MGYNSSAHIIIGVEIDLDKVLKIEKVRGCDHSESEAKFCAECGKPMWKDEPQTVRDYVEEQSLYDYVHYASDFGPVVIGHKLAKADSNAHLQEIDFEKLMVTDVPQTITAIMEIIAEKTGGKKGVFLMFQESC